MFRLILPLCYVALLHSTLAADPWVPCSLEGRQAMELWTLKRDLMSDDERAFQRASARAREMGTRALPVLIGVLREGTAVEQFRIVDLLAELDSTTEWLLRRSYRTLDSGGRACIEKVLAGRIGTTPPQLLAALGEDFEPLREYAARGLVKVGPKITPELVDLMQAGHVGCREAAYQVLREFLSKRSQRTEAARQLKRCLETAKREEVRRQCQLLLLERGDAEALSARLAALKDEHATVRWLAARELDVSIIRQPYEAVAVPLIVSMKDKNPSVRCGVARSLIYLTRSDHPTDAAVAALIPLVKANSTRNAALETLAEFGSAAKPAIPAAMSALSSEDSESRSAAAYALWRIGVDDSDAVPKLVRALGDANRDAASCVSLALARMRGRAVPHLTRALEGPCPRSRRGAAEALYYIGPEAAPAIPALVGALRDPDFCVRYCAAGALGRIGPVAAPAVPSLRHALGDEKAVVRLHAAGALGDLGAAAVGTIADLEALQADPSERVREVASEAIAKLRASSGTAT